MREKAFLSIILGIILLVSLPYVFGAKIQGTVYDYSLTKLDNVVVEISTTPVQRDVTENGLYSFEVKPGNYIIDARYYENGLLSASSEEEITIDSEGDFVLDIILFPNLEEEEELIEDVELDVSDVIEDEPRRGYIVVIVGAIFVLIIMFFLLRKRFFRKEKPEEVPIEKQDLDTVVSFIKKEGGRTTQKDIRKEVPLSEAKVSLMIAELEDKGIVRKIKKGRGNIIILK